MSDYSNYDISTEKYKRLFAAYLQNDGTQLMNLVRLKYDIVNNYKNQAISFWSLFDIDYLENLYITWKRANPSVDDSEWVYTGFVENICHSYQITREYYSYYANTEALVTGSILLNNLNMLRLLKIRRAAVGYDGTRESLEVMMRNSLNNKYRSLTEISFIIQTITTENAHASLNVYIVKPAVADILWTDYDTYLVKDGEYFIQLLGITINFEATDAVTLVYDNANVYDSTKEYK